MSTKGIKFASSQPNCQCPEDKHRNCDPEKVKTGEQPSRNCEQAVEH
ncbi:hypothetical protein Rcae01_00059 [Novipirellula caenicola]|uniref:Uncharacterized protein n=1 Tax=Novipirellula caenicola TaxID=1536901 RepID=A0ABP9VK28_9BACT